MTKEQQIEEMASFIHGRRDKNGSKKTAEALYNAGYRKVLDDVRELIDTLYNAARTRDEIDNLREENKKLKAENERLSEKLKQVLLSIDTVKEMNAISRCTIDEHRKEAVREFAEKLKKKVHNYYPSIDNYCTSRHVILVKDIDELLKEYEICS